MMRHAIQCTLAFLLLGSCSTGRIDRFSEVKEGMSKEQVEAILGVPSSRFEREVDDQGRIFRLERWQYGDTPGTLATGALFSEHPSNRVWAVYFDDEGKVLDVAEPDWTPEQQEPVIPSAIPPRNR